MLLPRFRGEEALPADSPEGQLAAAWNTLDVVMTENADAIANTRRAVLGEGAAFERGANVAAQFETLLGMRVPDILAATYGLERAINALRGREISWQQPRAPRAAHQPVEVSGETEYASRTGRVLGALVSPNFEHGVVALVEVETEPGQTLGDFVQMPNMYDITVGPAPETAS